MCYFYTSPKTVTGKHTNAEEKTLSKNVMTVVLKNKMKAQLYLKHHPRHLCNQRVTGFVLCCTSLVTAGSREAGSVPANTEQKRSRAGQSTQTGSRAQADPATLTASHSRKAANREASLGQRNNSA